MTDELTCEKSPDKVFDVGANGRGVAGGKVESEGC